jgi:hypothetical protein
MPKQYNCASRRFAALREGRSLTTYDAAHAAREPGPRGKRRDPQKTYKEGIMGKKLTMIVMEEAVPFTDTPLEKAVKYATTLILSGIEPRVAMMRAARSYDVPPRDVAVLLASATAVSTNVGSGPSGARS